MPKRTKSTNNGLQNTTEKAKDWAKRTLLKAWNALSPIMIKQPHILIYTVDIDIVWQFQYNKSNDIDFTTVNFSFFSSNIPPTFPIDRFLLPNWYTILKL
jgi:hypothetical protein